VKRGRKFSTENALSVNGKIFAVLTKGKFVVKLPEERADELVKKGVAANWGPGTRRVMKEWVTVESKASWVDIAKEAYRFVKQGLSWFIFSLAIVTTTPAPTLQFFLDQWFGLGMNDLSCYYL
jgi:hypothetical protein